MKKLNALLVGAEIFSIFALFMVFFKVLILKPACFDLFDNYFTIVPLLTAKILELSQIKLIKNIKHEK